MSNGMDLVDAIARHVMGALLNGLWAGVALTFLVWGLQQFFRQMNATTRYWVWWATLLAVVCLPFLWLGWEGPVRTPLQQHRTTLLNQLPVAPHDRQSTTSPLFSNPFSSVGLPALEPVSPSRDPDARGLGKETFDRQERKKHLGTAARSVPKPSATQSSRRGISLPGTDGPVFRVSPGPWVFTSLLIWLGLSLLMLARLGRSYRYLCQLKAHGKPLELPFRERLSRWLARFSMRRPVRLCQSDKVPMPLTVGLTDAVILFPERLIYTLSESELEQIGLHEAAHIRRWDDWGNLGQKLLEALFFYHPAVLWISRQLNLDREIACDDWVIAVTGRPRPYAACLTHLAELSSLTRRFIPALGALLLRKHLSRRIEMLLNQSRNRTVRLLSVNLLLVVVGLIAGLLQLSHFSPIVTFLKADHSQNTGSAILSGTGQPIADTSRAAMFAGGSAIPGIDSSQAAKPALKEEARDLEAESPGLSQELESTSEELNRNLKDLQKETQEHIRRGIDHEQLKKLLESRKDQIREQARRLADQAKELAGQSVVIHREEIERAMEQARDAMTLDFFDQGDGCEFIMNPRKPEVSESEVLPRLAEIARTDNNIDVRKEAISAIGRMASNASTEALLHLYDTLDNKELKKEVILHLRQSKGNSGKVVEKLRQVAQSSSDPELRETALKQLSRIQDSAGADALISLYDGAKDVKTRETIIRSLANNGSKKAIDKLMAIAKSDPDPQMRRQAVRRLGALSSGEEWGFFPEVREDINVVVPKVETPNIVAPKVITPKKAPAPGAGPTSDSSPAPLVNPQ